MAIGPVQLLVLGFKQPTSTARSGELERLRDNDLVRVIDALAVRKDADGNLEMLHQSQLGSDEQQAFGALVGGLIGLGAAGEGFEVGAERGAEAVAERGGVFSEEEAWDVLAEIPPDTAGLLILLEHRWAIPLRDAIARAGGFRLGVGVHQPPRSDRHRVGGDRGGRGPGGRRGRRHLSPHRTARRNHMLGPSRRVARRTARRNVGVAPVAAAAVVAAPTAGRRAARRTSRRVARRY
jgi:uncharacterized membrane protein